jgi:arginase
MEMQRRPERYITVIGVPSSAGARRSGQQRGPQALRSAGLIELLQRQGLKVRDVGDLPEAVYRPDADHLRSQNLELVERVARNVTISVERETGATSFLVILGGDCTITIGVLAGLAARDSRLGLVYLDGDLDLNTPETTPSGIFDGMVTAHLLGNGADALARIGRQFPLLPERQLAYFGYNVDAGGIDPPELVSLAASASLRFPIEVVRQNPAAAAREAIAALEQRAERILVHFDIDVTDTSAVDVPHRGGLSLDDTIEALKVFVTSPRCIGLVVTELNPELDTNGFVARALAQGIARSLGGYAGPTS